jgi:hypothetical protein
MLSRFAVNHSFLKGHPEPVQRHKTPFGKAGSFPAKPASWFPAMMSAPTARLIHHRCTNTSNNESFGEQNESRFPNLA